MSNNDRTKWEYFLNMTAIEFLNTVAFYKDKQKEEEKLMFEMRRR